MVILGKLELVRRYGGGRSLMGFEESIGVTEGFQKVTLLVTFFSLLKGKGTLPKEEKHFDKQD